MKNTILFSLILILVVTINSCQNKVEKNADEIQNLPYATESSKQIDNPVNNYLTEELKPIRENYKRLNSIDNWTEIKRIDLWKTTEGGEAKFYYQNEKIEKIISIHFGGMSKKTTEYYLKEGKLSFVLEKLYKYNRPIYYDKVRMEENNDNEQFDFDKSIIIEDRSYFKNNILIHQLNNQGCSSPFSQDYLKAEQNRILIDYELLVKLEKE